MVGNINEVGRKSRKTVRKSKNNLIEFKSQSDIKEGENIKTSMRISTLFQT